MSEPKLDWDFVEWIKPDDKHILRFAKGDLDYVAYQYCNWAFKEAGIIAVAREGSSCSLAYGTLIAVCQKYVKEHNIKEPDVVYVEVKKKGWFW